MSKRAVTPDPDLAKWCAALASTTVEEVPPGWVTVAQLAIKFGKADCTVSAQLTRAVREGRAETKRFRINTSRGPYPVPHYRLKP